jgi:hypothetical protein
MFYPTFIRETSSPFKRLDNRPYRDYTSPHPVSLPGERELEITESMFRFRQEQASLNY